MLTDVRAPPASTSRRVCNAITACTKRSVRIRRARRIHIARWLFCSEDIAPWKRQTTHY